MSSPRTLLQSTFGLDDFRPGQEAVIDALLQGHSALAVFPTGGGKSLCYQLPALLLDGLTLVISPLIALMKDQVDALQSQGVAAARLDSTLSYEEIRQLYGGLDDGTLKLLYVAPERLGSERFLQRLQRQRLSLLAIDEAHCISEWGHNFRPDYLKIARQARQLGVERILALTATATPSVAEDILRAFDIAPQHHVQTGFHRPNLQLTITPCSQQERLQLLIERLQQRPPGPTIVYVTLQKTAEQTAARLADQGLGAQAYHAGLKDDQRTAVQEAFMAGSTQIVVATIAFGMGIDKADIRYIYHFNLPKTLENYVQEIGRAGRDGQPSTCELLACADDCTPLANFTYGDTPTPQSLTDLVGHLLGQDEVFAVAPSELSVAYDIRPLVIATVLTYLELDGAVQGTGPFYAQYKYRFNRDPTLVAADYDPGRRQFLEQIFSASKAGRIWYQIDPAVAALELDQPRQRIIAALTYLEEQGDLEVQVTGLRHGYRRLRSEDPSQRAVQLAQTFADREERDIQRLDQVVALAEHPGCLSRHLLAYFGEELPEDCGHCSSCQDPAAHVLPRTPHPPFDESHSTAVAQLRSEGHEALAHPRQLARFLCGLSSPQASRARLGRHPQFGVLANWPFKDVLALVEK
ncbi:MAG: RecQ family ATP-dependent DNA helicase [Candidatus Latescibacteria bacterium]|nr:RecQ family ATP-dependent DNA helicase [Candidatus Latescibacterota bacterium]